VERHAEEPKHYERGFVEGAARGVSSRKGRRERDCGKSCRCETKKRGANQKSFCRGMKKHRRKKKVACVRRSPLTEGGKKGKG